MPASRLHDGDSRRALLKGNISSFCPPSPAGVCGEPQQDAAHRRHPAQEPDQADRVPEQLPEGPHGRRAVQRREDLPNQTDPRSEEARLLEEHPSLSSAPTFYR